MDFNDYEFEQRLRTMGGDFLPQRHRGAVAGAFYGVPDDIRTKAAAFLPSHLLETLHSFESKFQCNYERN